MQLLGDGQQGSGDGVVLGDHFRRNFRHTVYPDGHPLVDVPVGNALGFLVQLPQTVLLQLLAHCFLRHGVQEPLHFRLHSVREFRKIVPVDFYTAAHRLGHAMCLHQGHTAGFFRSYLLLSREFPRVFTRCCALCGEGAPCQGVGFLPLLRLGEERLFRLLRNGSRRALSPGRAAHQGGQLLLQFGKDRACPAGCLLLFIPAFQGLQVFPNMLPAPDEDAVNSVPAAFARGGSQVAVQQREQFKHGLDVHLAERLFPVLQLPELSIREEQLEQAIEHGRPLGFPLLELGDRGHLPPLPGPDKIQGLTQSSREPFQYPVLHGGVLQHVADFMGHPAQQGQVLRVFLGILPEFPLVFHVLHPGKFRLVRVPAAGGEVVSVGLLCQKIRVQAVPQLVGEKPAHHLVPVFPGGKFSDGRIPGVDGDMQIVGVG